MTRVDFYQLSRDPVERVVAMLAAKVIDAGDRLLVVCADAGLRQAISDALWAEGGREDRPAFLAHGMAGEADADRQPILLAGDCVDANGATMAILADGEWRAEAERFARVMLLFGAERTDAARALWRRFDDSSAIERHIFKQEGKRWREGA